MTAIDYSKLAGLYDALVTDTSDVEFFLACARRAGGPVAELMAGTGRLAIPLLEAGIDLTCVDSSPEMLEVLRAKASDRGLQARIVGADVTTLDLPLTFAAIFIAFHSFEELITTAAQRACLAAVRRHLVPKGLFVCTLHDVAVRLTAGPGAATHRFRDPRSGRDVVLSLDTRHDPASGVVAGTESFTCAGEDSPFLSVPLRFRLTTAEAFRALAVAAGFDVEAVLEGYTGRDYRPGESRTAVWMLRAS
jgi:SAM-dependent methyltransferase